MDALTEVLTTAELANRLRVPVETVRYWRGRGKGPRHFKAGRHVLYAVEDVERWIADARRTGDAA